jgi:hypothetical protein
MAAYKKYLISITVLIFLIILLPGYYTGNFCPQSVYYPERDSLKDNLLKITANEYVKPYTGIFLYGSNMGYYKGWRDDQIGDLLCGNDSFSVPGAGVKTLRPSLPAKFLERYGYENRLNSFKHYKSIGARDLTVFVGYPSDEQRDSTVFCKEKNQPTWVFKNLYKPIFIKTEKGYEVNPENYYAMYLFKTVSLYKDNVKFWEVWNEPDFDASGRIGWRERGYDKSWWNVNPDPCDLKYIKAPIFYYNRILRISYQVIKFVDSSAYVTTGGLGYESFMDAMLRNTDNPVDGSVTNDYPLKAGAYFDCLSYHIYPQFEYSVRHYDAKLKDWYYMRNSDAAAKSIVLKKDSIQNLLGKYGYDGINYPKKMFILTEYNIGSRKFGNVLGGHDTQKNFTIKSLVEIQKANISQAYIFAVGVMDELKANNAFDLMGLFSEIDSRTPFNYVYTDQGITFKTTSDILFGSKYDPDRTSELMLGDKISGGAFRKNDGKYIYVLWAVSDKDEFEDSKADYSFPEKGKRNLSLKYWDYSVTKSETEVYPKGIVLTSTPVFITEK